MRAISSYLPFPYAKVLKSMFLKKKRKKKGKKKE